MGRKISIVYSLHPGGLHLQKPKYPIDLFKKNNCSPEVDHYRNLYNYEHVYYLSRKDTRQARSFCKERYHGPRPN